MHLLNDAVPIRTNTWTLRPPATLPQTSTIPYHTISYHIAKYDALVYLVRTLYVVYYLLFFDHFV